MRSVFAVVASGVVSTLLFGQISPSAPARTVGDAGVAETPSAPSSAASDSILEGLAADDWASIRAAYEAGSHQVFTVESGYQARNPGQQLTTRFDGRGFCTTPDAGGFSFGLDLVSYGWGETERTVERPQSVTAGGARVAYAWDEQLTEWYVNDARGLEHGYTVAARPAEASGYLALSLAIRGDLKSEVSADGRDVRLVDATGAVVLRYAGLEVFDVDGRALEAGFGGLAGGLRIVVNDSEARYPLTIDPIVQQAYLKASNSGAYDQFGSSVAVSGDTVVVGAFGEASSATGVDGNQNDNSAVYAGAAYVFVRTGSSWIQQAYLKASNTDAQDWFGESVAISGDTVVVGARYESSIATGVDGNQSDNSALGAGAAYVFVRNGTIWSQQAYLKASNTDADDYFGLSVAVAGETIVVGASGESSSASGVDGDQSDNSAVSAGAAYVFVRSGTNWSQQAYLKASNPDGSDSFGLSVAVDGETVIVGAPNESSSATDIDGDQSDNSALASGASYVFVRNGIAWSQQAYLKASNTGASDGFGLRVAISGDTLVVGAYSEDSSATGVDGDESDNSAVTAGAAYVFVRSGTSWSQQAYLKASNTGRDDAFGWSVAVSGDTIVVGAYVEDSNATGIDGNQNDNSASEAGAAYVFLRSGSSWSQQAYLKGSNTDAGDRFGQSVAVSGETVVAGALYESSNTAGAGAVYVFGPPSGSFATYGTGTPGKGGFVPSIALSGSPAIGDDVTLSVSNGRGGASALLLVGSARANIPFAGGAILVEAPWVLVDLLLGGTPGVPGAGVLDVTDTIPDDPALVGVVVDFQVLVADRSAYKKLALSNGAELLIGG